GGEAGIGKSRLTHRLREHLRDVDYRALHFQCSPFHGGSALFPIIDQIERVAGFLLDDTVDQKLDRLEQFLAQCSKPIEQAIHLFAALLSLPTDRDPPLELPPQKRKELTLAALVGFVEALARKQPVLLIVEDAHWIDSATQEWLDLLVPRLQRIAALGVITYRPEYLPSWTGLAHVTAHSLNRLTPRQAVEMVVRLGSNREWPTGVLDQIVANADGVPLFVEELSKAVLESGIVRLADGRYELTGPLSPLAIPATLKDSLTARLDRLGPVKELAQIGACIGREFGYALLAAVSSLTEHALRGALDQLIHAQLMYRQGSVPHESYMFKHALVQDAAYQSLITANRQRHHERIASVLVRQFPGEVAARPEIVASHFSRAGLSRQALDYWQRAGELAISRSAYVETITHFNAALLSLEDQAQNTGRDQRELAIRVKLGPAYQAINGMGSQEAGSNYERACEIGARIGHSPEAFQGLWGYWLYCNLTGRGEAARARADQLVLLSNALGDDEFVLQAHHARWTTFQNLGELAVTRFDIEEGLRLYDRKRHAHHAHTYGGHDPGVCCRTQGAMCLWVSGYPDRANGLVDEGIALARELEHPFSLAVGLWFGGAVKLFRDDAAQGQAFAAELRELSQRHGFKSTEPHAIFQLGWAQTVAGHIQSGLRLMEQGEDRLRVLGQHGWRHFCLATMAEAHARLGETARALALVNQAIELAERTNIESWRPEFLRRRAQWMLDLGELDTEGAKQQLLAALALARQQTAHMLELRVATSLARVLANGEERAWAADTLARCLGRFVEGTDASDLVSARKVLTELRPV
ncbi:MAG: ATP-binding protein, partial [Burkholderiales bacterium]